MECDQVAAPTVSPVEALCVASVEHLHPRGEVRVGRLDDEVVVRAHQAVRLAAPFVRPDRRPEEVEEVEAVADLAIGEGLVDRARRDVEDPILDLDPWRPWHVVHGTSGRSRNPRCGRFGTVSAQLGHGRSGVSITAGV